MGQVFGRQDDDLALGPAWHLVEGRNGTVHSLRGEGFQLTVSQAHNRIRQRAQGLIEGLVLRGNVQEVGFKLAEEQAGMRSIASGTVVPSDILGYKGPTTPSPTLPHQWARHCSHRERDACHAHRMSHPTENTACASFDLNVLQIDFVLYLYINLLLVNLKVQQMEISPASSITSPHSQSISFPFVTLNSIPVHRAVFLL